MSPIKLPKEFAVSSDSSIRDYSSAIAYLEKLWISGRVIEVFILGALLLISVLSLPMLLNLKATWGGWVAFLVPLAILLVAWLRIYTLSKGWLRLRERATRLAKREISKAFYEDSDTSQAQLDLTKSEFAYLSRYLAKNPLNRLVNVVLQYL